MSTSVKLLSVVNKMSISLQNAEFAINFLYFFNSEFFPQITSKISISSSEIIVAGIVTRIIVLLI